MRAASAWSSRASAWAGAVAYLIYQGVLFCFATPLNSLFLRVAEEEQAIRANPAARGTFMTLNAAVQSAAMGCAALVGGALIGGASLKADDFLGIARAARAE